MTDHSSASWASRLAQDDDLVAAYGVREPNFILQDPSAAPKKSTLFRDSSSNSWLLNRDSATREATLLCAGSILYNDTLEQNAQVGASYEFRSLFKHIRPCLQQADLAIGSLGSIVADMHPRQSDMTETLAGAPYMNARPEYLEALHFAGFRSLALANPYNLTGGVRGVSATAKALLNYEILPSGIGWEKHPILQVNGINISVHSYTLDMYRVEESITAEGAESILSIFHPETAQSDIEAARAAGAEFVVAYVDCSSQNNQHRLAQRLEAAKLVAESGADYVICTIPHVVSRYYKHITSDGRTVPLVTGLGTFMAGSDQSSKTPTALIKLTIQARGDGQFEVEDSYIPCRRFRHYRGAISPVVPALRQFNRHYKAEDFRGVAPTVKERLGRDIQADQSRKVWISTHFRPQLSPQEIADVLDADLPLDDMRSLGLRLDEKVHSIVTRKGDLRPGCVAVLVQQTSYRRDLDQITSEDAMHAGAVMLIASETNHNLPTLVVDKPWAAFEALVTSIRNKYSPVTVAITGTVGKTTAKELMSSAFRRHYRTLAVEGNNNTLPTAGLVVQKLSPTDEAYIQEVHGGHIGAASTVSKVVKPDICLITNIGNGHLGQMGSIANVIEGKMQITDGIRQGGVVILNNDNEHLRRQQPPIKTIRYSSEDSSCDYYAQKIRDTGQKLEFQIVSPGGVFDAVLNFQGLHNVNNAVGVFAAARTAGIPPHKIIAGLSRYKPETVRQNLIEVGGYKLLIDTYSSTPESVVSAAETLCSVPTPPGSRRIAVVGDIPDQGEKSRENHFNVGTRLGQMHFDLLLCCGEDSRYIVEAAQREGLEAHYFESRDNFNRKIVEASRPGDTLLFKGGTRVYLLEKTLRPLFGKVV